MTDQRTGPNQAGTAGERSGHFRGSTTDIQMEGTTFGDVPLRAELKLEVWDSPNSAGVVIDAIRCLKLGLDRGLAGTLVAPSSYFMKSPPVQVHDDVARERVEAFIRGEDDEVRHGTETPAPRQVRRTAPARTD